jgi:hypothetical protein
MCGVGGVDSEPTRVTYLYNGDYTAISVAQPLDCELNVGDTPRQSHFEAMNEQGYYLPVGEVHTNILQFSIVKGDSKPFTPAPQSLTSAIALTVEGLQWIDNPEGLHFEYDYATSALLDGTPIAPKGTYRPALTIDGNRMLGEWHTFYGEEMPDFVIRLVAADGEVLYQQNIREQISAGGDTAIRVDIHIEFSLTQIRCTIADWSETVERMVVDIE